MLAGVYGPGTVLDDGVVPRRRVLLQHFHRKLGSTAQRSTDPRGRDRPDPRRGGCVRRPGGQPALPSGVSYVLEAGDALAHVLPELFSDQRVQPVAEYPERLLDALQAAAPAGVADPQVAVP